SEAELEAIQLMMEFTKVKAGEGFRQEALLADEIIQTIEAQAGLSDQAVEYIRGLMPGLDLTDNGDLGLLHDALLLLKSLR
ncbi:MAG: hypothetical protein NTZ48_04535, partial [Candidatus Omnitrophica bacterium]|nr:hypothetical protein [Candidatus Omnitrophota bacterium]